MMDTVDGGGSGGLFIDENQANCGPIPPTGNLHPSPPGADLQLAREPKQAAGQGPAIAGARCPTIGMHPSERVQSPRCGFDFRLQQPQLRVAGALRLGQ